MTLAMLAASGYPNPSGGMLILQLLISPDECVPGGRTPNLSKLRRWGCTTFLLSITKADRKKDWEDNAMVEYFMGYWVTQWSSAVHVLFHAKLSLRDWWITSESSMRQQ